jgi:hypothetical protein
MTFKFDADRVARGQLFFFQIPETLIEVWV